MFYGVTAVIVWKFAEVMSIYLPVFWVVGRTKFCRADNILIKKILRVKCHDNFIFLLDFNNVLQKLEKDIWSLPHASLCAKELKFQVHIQLSYRI